MRQGGHVRWGNIGVEDGDVHGNWVGDGVGDSQGDGDGDAHGDGNLQRQWQLRCQGLL